MQQKYRQKLKVTFLLLFIIIFFATAVALFVINFGRNFINVSANLKQDEFGNYIVDREEYFDISRSSDGKKVTFNGLTKEGYKVLGTSVQSANTITVPFVLHIPDGITHVGGNFLGCGALKGITIPEGAVEVLTALGKTSVKSLVFPKTISSISVAVKEAPLLESVSVNEYTAEELAAGATQKMYSVNDQYVVQGAKTATSGKTVIIGAGGDVTLTEDISSIGNYAFRYRKTLKSIFIPRTVNQIFDLSLSATSLESITIDKANTKYSDGSNLDANGNIVSSGAIPGGNCIVRQHDSKFCELYIACGNTVVPDCVTRYSSSAYKGITGAENIVVPRQITFIEANALAASDVKTLRVEEGFLVFTFE